MTPEEELALKMKLIAEFKCPVCGLSPWAENPACHSAEAGREVRAALEAVAVAYPTIEADPKDCK